jgi:hypothetical protein
LPGSVCLARELGVGVRCGPGEEEEQKDRLDVRVGTFEGIGEVLLSKLSKRISN